MTATPIQLSFLRDIDLEEPQDKNLPKTYKGIYAMHKYWSKKPYNLIANYIRRFSSPSDIVIDSFCGSGVTVIESVRLKRRAVGIDINPVAILITEMGLSHVDIQALKQSFQFLKTEAKPIIDSLYQTKCLKCGSANATITHTIWGNGYPQEVWYECPDCKTRKDIRNASDGDFRAASEPIVSPHWYPSTQLIENARVNAKADMGVSNLFTQRALAGLSLLLEKIHQIEDPQVRSTLKFCFSAALPQASNMVFVIRRRGKTTGKHYKGKTEVGSWVIGYWIPSEHFEINVWRCFENRFKRIVRGKKEVNSVIPSSAIQFSTFEDLAQAKEGYFLEKGTATDLRIPDNAIDYALIDPPHGNRIPYLELSLMWNSWLGFESDWENEIVISEAKNRPKRIEDYQSRMLLAFSELWRVLKPGKFASIIFNSLDDKTWLSLLNACLDVGFEIKDIQPLAYSANSVVQDTRKHALKTDFVITCRKAIPKRKRSISFKNNDSELHDRIRKYLSQHENGVETFQILNHLLVSSIPTGETFKVSLTLKVLNDNFKFYQGRWYLNSLIEAL